MPIKILMPALSPTMTEGTLASWQKKEGDQVDIGDVIAEIETDKATMEVEAVEEGKLGKILVEEGTEGVPVNEVIALLLEEGEDESALEGADTGSPAPKDDEDEAPESRSAADDDDEDDDEDDDAASEEADRTRPASGEVPGGTTAPKGDAGVPVSLAESVGAFPEPPESDEDKYFDKTKSQTVREALRDAMAEMMRSDDRVFVMGEEVAEYEGAYKVTQGLLDEFGAKRVIDTPITEHGFAGLGVGAAMAGLRPVVEFMTFNFAMQAIDHIINSAAKTLYMSGGQMGTPIVFRGPNGAAARVAAQHSQDYASWYAHCPGLKVVAPWSAADAKGLLKSAIRDPNPVIFLENEILYGQTFDVPESEDFSVPIGRAKVVRQGKDVTITAYSIMVAKALQAADALAEDGIEAEVIDLRSIRPLDVATVVNSVKKTNRIVSTEEGWPFASIGSEIAALMMEHAFDYLDAPVARVCAEDVPMPYAANLERLALPQSDNIVEAAKAVCYR